MAVLSHLVAHDSENLYHSAIVQSGALHAAFHSLDRRRPMVDFHRRFAAKVGCPAGSNLDETVECLQKKSPEDLYNEALMFDDCNLLAMGKVFFTATHSIPSFHLVAGVMAFPAPWKPSLDADFASEPFFKEEPHIALENGKIANVPIMIGHTEHEGLIVTANLMQYPEKVKLMM